MLHRVSHHNHTNPAMSPSSTVPPHLLNHPQRAKGTEKMNCSQGSPNSHTSCTYISPAPEFDQNEEYNSPVTPTGPTNINRKKPNSNVSSSEVKEVASEKASYGYNATSNKYNNTTYSAAMWREESTTECSRRASSHPGVQRTSHVRQNQRGEMGAFEHLTELLYDDLNRDEFDVYLKKEI